MKRSSIIKRGLVFSAVMILGLYFLYQVHLIGVISVLIILGIALGISGMPSERIASYPADAAVSFVQKIKGFFRK